ncbi:DUF1569 domain-containing protein [Dawidia soli]|uniref:DUF1569 domain-containing protein n=1 Tax=Dawidia soli TaxID=2782352 RepID=A0AAP2DCQ5_9BACT|nr:DUF1569 domain-containing protein [Dawidia soli]MBT1688405.1 DUF1569 domain-containing protein [Dawidia soli]
MKTLFEEATRNELIQRVHSLQEGNEALWGKMNAYQMAKHCTLWDEWVHGRNNPVYTRSFLGQIFGKWALKNSVKDGTPMQRNIPTSRDLVIRETSGDLGLQKKKWMELIAAYAFYSNPAFVHDFFGKMTKEEIGIFAYKHADHHLRQFNC